MLKQSRVLYGITYQSHTELGLDEMNGLENLGYTCAQFEYGGRKGNYSGLKKTYRVILNAMKLVKKAYKFKPDCIYLNSRLEYIACKRDVVTIFLVRLFCRRKIIILIKSHGSDLEVLNSDKPLYAKFLLPYLKKQVNGWLFLSSEEINWIKTNNLMDSRKIFLTKNIVRLDKFKIDKDFRKTYGISDNKRILLFIGRLIKEKGILYVLDAFAEIKDKYNAILLVVGDGEEMNTVQKKIELYGIRNDVILTGWVDEGMATYFTSNSDILVFPTFFPEGFPMVIFNSLAAGLPVITTKIRAASDYLIENENCIWVEPKSCDSIIEGVAKLLDNETLFSEISFNNKKKAELFSRERVSRELAEIIGSYNNSCSELV